MNRILKNKTLIYAIIGVILLTIIVIGSTFAFFSASTSNDNISGDTLDIKLLLDVKKVSKEGSKSSKLIPIYDGSVYGYDSQLNSAATALNQCVDKNDFTVCQVYEITIGNGGTDDILVDSYVSFNKGNVINLKWANMSNLTTVGLTHNIIDNSNDVILSNINIPGNSNNTKQYIMVYVNNTGNDQSEQDKNSFSGVITVVASTGDKITAHFNT